MSVEGKRLEAWLIAYFFECLERDEKNAVEKEFFANDDVFELLLALEDEITSDYIRSRVPQWVMRRYAWQVDRDAAQRDKVREIETVRKLASWVRPSGKET